MNNCTKFVKTEIVVSKVGNYCSEKIVNVSDYNRLKIRVSAADQNSSSAKGISGDQQARHLVQNHANFRKSLEPGRLLYYDSDGSWVDYPEEVADLVKCCFREGKAMVEVSMQGRDCIVDLYRMLEVQFDSGHEKSIAWIDVSGKCFFPNLFVNSSMNSASCDGNGGCEEVVGDNFQKTAVDVKVLDQSDHQRIVCKRKRETEDIKVNQALKGKSMANSPPVNNLMAKRHQFDANGSEMAMASWSKTRLLREEDKRYKVAKNLFLYGLGETVPGAVVTRIRKCTRNGRFDQARNAVFNKQMELVEKARGDSCTVYAWYGTSAAGVESILAHGFVPANELKRFHPCGFGVYLAPMWSSRYSAMLSEIDENGERHAILCRVILGKCEKVTSSDQFLPSSPDFDTGVDDLTNTRWYVVWQTQMNTHILPEIVVSFRSCDHIQDQVTGGSSVKLAPHTSNVTFPELVSKLGGSLPPSKCSEIQDLIVLYKDGKVGKDTIMRHFISVVGDEAVRGALHEICG